MGDGPVPLMSATECSDISQKTLEAHSPSLRQLVIHAHSGVQA